MTDVKNKIAFLTMDSLTGFVVYDDLAKTPLAELGWQVVDVPWRSEVADWGQFAAVVIRSPWDYHLHCDAFLNLINAIEHERLRTGTRLLNSAAVVRWNIDKRYLRDLESRDVAIVPTQWVEAPTLDSLRAAFAAFAVDELVVKPIVGAGSRDTFRVRSDNSGAESCLGSFAASTAMIQPFLTSVVEQGEWSLFYFADKYSHAVLKTPKAGDFRTQEEYGSHLSAIQPTNAIRQLADRAVAAIIEPTLYARVDIVLLGDGSPAVIELELIEPSLYFPYDKESPWRFARAVDQLLRSN